ncbi:WD and tetratricopeptide repeats protein 1 [Glycine max]|nr:WD and tetratricopeptide repeats protein 1 [Glycine max]
MDSVPFRDGNIHTILDSRYLHSPLDVNHSLHTHSSLIRRLSQERELEGHTGCVNAVAWNSKGSLLISGSDDQRINIWSYSGWKLLHSIDTGHTANIFCTKFIPETSDELVASGAGDAEVRLFNLSRLNGSGFSDNAIIAPSAYYQCHTRRVKKLAVENGNPNVVWSASEDGTLRQHDFREGTSCPPAGSSHQECRNILLDLRSGSKRSLADPPKQVLALKSCDISSTKPHLLLVGGSDAFARLYDRRMLPPLSSCQKRMSPPPCVNYFCPMHLSDRMVAIMAIVMSSERNDSCGCGGGSGFLGHPSLHLTHVTFSPDGHEVLLSYSGEHVYLMNVNHAGVKEMQYTSGDESKLMTYSPTINGSEMQPCVSNVFPNRFPIKKNIAAKLDKCRKQIKYAKKSLDNGIPYYGIDACNEVLNGYSHIIGPALKHECLCTRAALLVKRKWKNDAHMAIRDCYAARIIDNSSYKALYYMSEALSQLGRHEDALEFAVASHSLAPSKSEVAERVANVKRDIALAEAEKNSQTNDGASRFDSRGGRILSLSDILYCPESNSDDPHDGSRSERDDSDYDDELELDFETSISGDEGHDLESNILHGNLNLRIHGRGDSRDNADASGSCESPSSSSQNSRTSYQPEPAVDMKQRFVGHCNIGTDIKQASFLGQRGEYVASGSDDGRWFIWEKCTGRLIKMLSGDESVVNCVQCHPFDFVVATSGIDSTIKIWTPTAPVPSSVAGGSAGPETGDVLVAMESNQQKLSRPYWNHLGGRIFLKGRYACIHLNVLKAKGLLIVFWWVLYSVVHMNLD